MTAAVVLKQLQHNGEGQKWAKLSLQIIYNAQKGGFSLFGLYLHIRFLVMPFPYNLTDFSWKVTHWEMHTWKRIETVPWLCVSTQVA